MPDKVWLLWYDNYESDRLLSVHATEASAKEAARLWAVANGYHLVPQSLWWEEEEVQDA